MKSVVVRTPGLYLRGVESPALPGGMTAVTGMVGVSERGPLHDPQPICSWGEYIDVFGGLYEYGYLADAVYGFFLNGGEKCYPVRVANTGLESVAGTCIPVEPLTAATNSSPVLDHQAAATLSISAINEGRWGDEIIVEISRKAEKARLTSQAVIGASTVVVDTTFDFARHEPITIIGRDGNLPAESYTVDGIDPVAGTLTLTTAIATAFPEGSIVSGQQLSRKTAMLARMTADAGAADTIIKVTSAADFVPGDHLHLVHRDNRFVRREYEVKSSTISTGEVELESALGADFPRDSDVLGRGFRMTVYFRQQREDFEDLSMNPDHSRYFVDAINGDIASRASYVDRRKDGHSILIQATHELSAGVKFKPLPGLYTFSGGGDGLTFAHANMVDAADIPAATVTSKIPGKAQKSYSVISEAFSTTLALPVPLSSATDHIAVANADGFTVGDVIDIEGEAVTLTAVDTNHNILTLSPLLMNQHLLDAVVNVPGRFTLRVRREEVVPDVEVFRNLNMDPADPAHFAQERINNDSATICIDAVSTALLKDQAVVLDGAFEPGDIDARYYTGYDDDLYFAGGAGSDVPVYGLSRLESMPEINLVTVPDLSRLVDAAGDDAPAFSDSNYAAALNQILFHCRKMGERYALVEPPPSVSIENAVTWPAIVSSADLAKFGAMYYPWLRYRNVDTTRDVPPSGFVAGMTARSDRQHGVNKVAANLDARGVVTLETLIDADQQGELNLGGLNCFRSFENAGVKLWGGRGLGLDFPANYISARRVVLAIVKVLGTGMLWAVFEPNDTSLWKRIETSLSAYLRGLLARGMMAGANAAEAFYVKCDAETNSSETIAAGQVITEIGVALVVPAEFIIITVKQTADTLEIVETAA